MDEKKVIDVEETQKELQARFDDAMTAVGTLIKKIEAIKEVGADWQISTEEEDKEENEKIINFSKNIDCGVNFVLRQLLVRYGNLLFIG